MTNSAYIVTVNKAIITRRGGPIQCHACGKPLPLGVKALSHEGNRKRLYMCLECNAQPILIYPLAARNPRRMNGEKVHVPFQARFRESMLNGKKMWTSRTSPFGSDGQCFEAFGTIFQLIDVRKRSLGYVAAHGYRLEGFESEQDFIECWKHLHPRKGFNPEQIVWVHEFRKIDQESD